MTPPARPGRDAGNSRPAPGFKPSISRPSHQGHHPGRRAGPASAFRGDRRP